MSEEILNVLELRLEGARDKIAELRAMNIEMIICLRGVAVALDDLKCPITARRARTMAAKAEKLK